MRRARSSGEPSREILVSETPSLEIPGRKRQRTMLESFQSLSLRQPNQDMVTEDNETHSSWATGGGSVEDEDSTSEEEEMCSDEAKANKAIVYQLVLGGAAKSTPQNPVDAKLEDMIRQSCRKATVTDSKDDFDILPSYHRPSMMKVNPALRRPRSNSLPRDWEGSAEMSDVHMTL